MHKLYEVEYSHYWHIVIRLELLEFRQEITGIPIRMR